MIKNDKQYKITNKRIVEINDAIKKAKALGKADAKRQAYINSLVIVQKRLHGELKEYLKLKDKGVTVLKKVNLKMLPSVLIQYKIAKGYTQKQYSQILGIKEQQLQRYEAENYSSVSFGRLLEYLEKTKLKVNVAVE
jgi:DNA-binding XRE family transcriptional regulator